MFYYYDIITNVKKNAGDKPPQARPPTPSSLTLMIIAFGVSLDTTLQLISKAT
jgi:hypothetical protein